MKLRSLKQAKKRTARKPGRPLVCEKRVRPQTFLCRSQSDPKKTYTVKYQQVSDRWEWSCSCPAFTFKGLGQDDCKHIRAYILSAKRAGEFCDWKSTVSGKPQTTPGVCPQCGGKTVEEPELEEE